MIEVKIAEKNDDLRYGSSRITFEFNDFNEAIDFIRVASNKDKFIQISPKFEDEEIEKD